MGTSTDSGPLAVWSDFASVLTPALNHTMSMFCARIGIPEKVLIAAIRDMMPSWDAHWRRMVAVDELFDDVIISFAVGCREPERAIYELATRRAGVEPERCVLVDDQIANVEAARESGWTAIHFTNTADAVIRLGELLDGGSADAT